MTTSYARCDRCGETGGHCNVFYCGSCKIYFCSNCKETSGRSKVTVCPECKNNLNLQIKGRIEQLERLQPWHGKRRRKKEKKN